MTVCWVGVASRDHVQAAVHGGFCQLNHGKEAPLRLLEPGDRLVYYSPREKMNAGEPLQAFTAAGEVLEGKSYQVEVSGTFRPFRRAVRYFVVHEATIQRLLPHLSFTAGRASWGQAMRRGCFRIPVEDYRVIAAAMQLGEKERLLDRE